MNGLYLLLTITRRADAAEYEEFFKRNNISVTYSINCNGTAHAKTLALLGIEKNEKTMLLSFVSESILRQTIRGLTVDMKIDLPDRGIAVAIPFSGIGGAKALEYFTSGQPQIEEDGSCDREERNMQTAQELIIAIYEKGYTDLVMDAAREAGAAGGTTIKAKGTGAGGAFVTVPDTLKFWDALVRGKLISKELVSQMFRKQSGDGSDPEEGWYGFGLWIINNPNGVDIPYFQGCDPGVSFISEYNPNTNTVAVLVSNYGDNVWQEMRKIREALYGNLGSV